MSFINNRKKSHRQSRRKRYQSGGDGDNNMGNANMNGMSGNSNMGNSNMGNANMNGNGMIDKNEIALKLYEMLMVDNSDSSIFENYEYEITYPDFKPTNTLYDGLYPRVPFYGLNPECDTMNIPVRCLPVHQREEFSKYIATAWTQMHDDGIISDETFNNGQIPIEVFNEANPDKGIIKNVWLRFYHPRNKGLCFGSMFDKDSNGIVNFFKDNPDGLVKVAQNFINKFGNMFCYRPDPNNNGGNLKPSPMINQYSFNYRVKAIAFKDLPEYQQKWLRGFVYYQINSVTNGYLNGIMVGSVTKPTVTVFEKMWMQQPNFTNVEIEQKTVAKVINSIITDFTTIPDNLSQFDQSWLQQLANGTFYFLDWDISNSVVMPLHPSQIYYHFNMIHIIQSILQDTAEAEKERKAVETESNTRQSTGLSNAQAALNAQILKDLENRSKDNKLTPNKNPNNQVPENPSNPNNTTEQGNNTMNQPPMIVNSQTPMNGNGQPQMNVNSQTPMNVNGQTPMNGNGNGQTLMNVNGNGQTLMNVNGNGQTQMNGNSQSPMNQPQMNQHQMNGNSQGNQTS